MNHPEQQSSFEPTTSEHQSVPSTSVSSFPTYASEYYNNHMDQNQMIMFNSMGNYHWPDNHMYPMPMMNNMPMNSTNLSYERNVEPVNSDNTNSNQYESQPQTESDNSEMVRLQSPLVVPYSDEAAASLMENLRNEDTFKSALQTLTTWLLNSELNKSNVTCLFPLIHLAQKNVWRLMNDKANFKEDFNQVKLEMNQKLNAIITEFQEIWKVFEVVKLQKVWDQFTKPQRKQISAWIEETKEIMASLKNQLAAENMDPDEDSSEKSPNNSEVQHVVMTENCEDLKEELNSLLNQIKAAEDEKAVMQNDLKKMKRCHQENMRKIDEECKEIEKETESIKSFLAKVRSPNNTTNEESSSKPIPRKNLQARLDTSSAEGNVSSQAKYLEDMSSQFMYLENVSNEDVRLISLTGTFLIRHPFGASVEYIWSYLNLFNSSIDCRYVDNLLSRFPKIFRAESKGVGAALTKEWFYLGFEHLPKQN